MIKIDILERKISSSFTISVEKLTIDSSEIVAIIGNNGSGKTIFLNSLINNINLDNGNITILGIPNKSDAWKKSAGIYLNKNYLLDFMTPLEFFYFISSFYNLSKSAILQKVKVFTNFLQTDMNHIKNKRISYFSNGTKDKIGIISALLHQPKLLIFDEPFAHLDIPSIHFLLDYWHLLKNNLSSTILIACPNLFMLKSFCTRILLFNQGQIILDLPNNPRNIAIIDEYFKDKMISATE